MAVPTKSQARLFALLISELEPQIRRAFMASVTDLQAGVNWPLLLERLTAQDTEGAIAALNINAAAWAEYSATMTTAYAKAGASTMAQIQAVGVAPIGVRFDMSNPRAQQWIRESVAESVVGFTREQITGARAVIEAGYARGEGPRTIATDLAGRVTGGTRQGGILGLDNPRAARLQAVKVGMRTPEGVQALVIKGQDGKLTMRYKVNAATEKRIFSAYNAGTEVPEAARLISERQYQSALLKARADTVSQTETASAVANSTRESWTQTAEARGLDAGAVQKKWVHLRGSKEGRIEHIQMNGVTVMGLNTPFILPSGQPMQNPHDPAGGAKQNINCACNCIYSLSRAAGLI